MIADKLMFIQNEDIGILVKNNEFEKIIRKGSRYDIVCKDIWAVAKILQNAKGLWAVWCNEDKIYLKKRWF